MPDKRKHRGRHPEDNKLFSESQILILRNATEDVNYLLSRGYSISSSILFVGDKYQLNQRQRNALSKVCCSDTSLKIRESKMILPADCSEKNIAIDGYNLLITLESALSGGIILEGREGCYRDIAGVHGTYRKVEETIEAVRLLGQYLISLNTMGITFYLDSPVSNSRRLKTLLSEYASSQGWMWNIEVVHSPDAILKMTNEVVCTADSNILDNCNTWINLARHIIDANIPNYNVVNVYPH